MDNSKEQPTKILKFNLQNNNNNINNNINEINQTDLDKPIQENQNITNISCETEHQRSRINYRLKQLSSKIDNIFELSDNLFTEFSKTDSLKQNINVNEIDKDSDFFCRQIKTNSSEKTLLLTQSKPYKNFLKKVNKKWREKQYKKRFKVINQLTKRNFK